MRPLKLGGLVAASLILVGSACGSAPSPRTTRAELISTPAPREPAPGPVTTTTTAAPTTTVAPKPAPRRTAAAPRVSRSTGGGWDALKQCESGGNYNTNSGNGFYGAYQFDRGTWNSNNVAGGEWGSATPEQQDAAAQHLYAQRGASPWPVCGRHLK